ncbi:MAG: NRDE family protein, partial [Candidatus Sumerlaeia bacterium]|nr:NRDE family protein [Candidatus Sumerlaeia bacterium]
MCLLLILRGVVPEWPLVVAANRDERYDRPGEPPRLLCAKPRVFGGCDSLAGGTWLAVNQWGMVVAVTNRPRTGVPQGPLRSRGLLALDAARQKSPIAIADMLSSALAAHEYDGFNLFCSTLAESRVFYFDGTLREKPLHRGVFALATGEANDPASPKVQRALAWLATERERPMDQWMRR